MPEQARAEAGEEVCQCSQEKLQPSAKGVLQVSAEGELQISACAEADQSCEAGQTLENTLLPPDIFPSRSALVVKGLMDQEAMEDTGVEQQSVALVSFKIPLLNTYIFPLFSP